MPAIGARLSGAICIVWFWSYCGFNNSAFPHRRRWFTLWRKCARTCLPLWVASAKTWLKRTAKPSLSCWWSRQTPRLSAQCWLSVTMLAVHMLVRSRRFQTSTLKLSHTCCRHSCRLMSCFICILFQLPWTGHALMLVATVRFARWLSRTSTAS